MRVNEALAKAETDCCRVLLYGEGELCGGQIQTPRNAHTETTTILGSQVAIQGAICAAALCFDGETHHISTSTSHFEVNRVVATPMTAAMVTAALEATAAKIKPKDAHPFRKGDAVVYPAHGVGRIERVGFEEIAGHRLNLIHISFEDNRMTLRIPVAQARTAGLRKLASEETVAAALAILKGRPRASRLMWAKRSQEYLAKINTGDPGALAEVVRDLQSADDNSSFSQRRLFELALERLAGEFAAVRRIAKADAIELLNQTLIDARADRAAAHP